jgi:hypothetical protein
MGGSQVTKGNTESGNRAGRRFHASLLTVLRVVLSRATSLPIRSRLPHFGSVAATRLSTHAPRTPSLVFFSQQLTSPPRGRRKTWGCFRNGNVGLLRMENPAHRARRSRGWAGVSLDAQTNWRWRGLQLLTRTVRRASAIHGCLLRLCLVTGLRQKTVWYRIGVAVDADDLTSRVDTPSQSAGRAWEVERGEIRPSHAKCVYYSVDIHVCPCDLATRINVICLS